MGGLSFLEHELAELERDHLLRIPRSTDDLPPGAVRLCSNDYLGFASRDVAPRGSGGAGASALVWGHGPEHLRAESELARYTGVESCLLFSSGYAANVGTVSALVSRGDLVVSDALNHASIVDGCRLSGARVVVYPHCDLEAARRALRAPARRRLLVTESYFSMDGDGPDLLRARAVSDEAGAILLVDEAHALGVLGPSGRGRCAEARIRPDVLIGTLGKAWGLGGAFVGGSADLRRWLWNRARSFVFSTAMSPALASAAAERVVEVEKADGARARVAVLADRLRDGLARETGVRPLGFGPIIPFPVAGPGAAVEMASRLLREGWVTQPMRPPTVPPGTSRLRLTVHASLDLETVDRAVVAIAAAHRLFSVRDVRGPEVSRRRVLAVVGTGTEIGKTYVSSRLVSHMAALGVAVAGRKPIESGVVGAVGADQGELEGASSVAPARPSPYRFSAPLSPHLAARMEGVAVEIEAAASWALEDEADVTVVETAGGLLSPLGPGASNLDLVLRLRPDAVLLVAPDRLGVLHDVTAALTALGRAGLGGRTVVCLVAPASADASTGSNEAELLSLGLADCVVAWPRHGAAAEETWQAAVGRFRRST